MKKIIGFIFLITFSHVLFAQEGNYNLKFASTVSEAVKVSFPILGNFSGQVDLQYATQSTYSNKNPFGYGKNLDRRAWLIYKGFKNTKLAIGYSYKDKYEIPEVVTHNSDEHRIIAYALFTQPKGHMNMFEQIRTETRFFEDSKGIDRVVNRLRIRFGNTYFLTPSKNQSFSWYSDAALRFASSSYTTSLFDTFKQSVYYSAGINSHLSVDAIYNAQVQLKPNGKQYIFSYGPQLVAKYSL